MDALSERAEQLERTQLALASAREEQLSLMSTIRSLREVIAQRDEEMRRAAEAQVELVSRWAEEEEQQMIRRASSRRDGPTPRGRGR